MQTKTSSGKKSPVLRAVACSAALVFGAHCAPTMARQPIAVEAEQTDSSIKKLIEDLSDPDAKVRVGATKALEHTKEDISAAVPGLVKLLSDENAGIRWSAANGLANAAASEKSRDTVIPLLVKLLSDKDAKVGAGAVRALLYADALGAVSKDPKTRETIIKHLEDASSDANAARLLEEIRNQK